MSKFSEQVECIVDSFDFSGLVAQICKIGENLSAEEKDELAVVASTTVFKATTDAFINNLGRDSEGMSKTLIPYALQVIFKNEPFEVRLWSDLLHVDRVHSFDNEIPLEVWNALMEAAQELCTKPSLSEAQQKHLEGLARRGIIPVPVHTREWRQWISINGLALLSEETKQLLFQKLTLENLSTATRNFLAAQSK
jgi:hypothetical protein